MSEELKPCPFCGGEAVIENDGFYRWAECKNKECEASARVFAFIHDAGNADDIVAKNWNTRPIEDALRAALAEANEDAEALYQEAEYARRFICSIFGTDFDPTIPALVLHRARCAKLEGGESVMDSPKEEAKNANNR